jgi:uncharacterized repeat protein (TIGR01451 family)
MGEVWCVTLWEARANLVAKYGHATGNELILRLVTDGMNLSPPNPNFLQARDAILQASQVYNGGADLPELWAAFAKRGMGFGATSPSSSTTAGLHESFDIPDDLSILPVTGFISSGEVGGPFNPTGTTFTLANIGDGALTWSASSPAAWLNLSLTGGTLAAGATNAVTVSLNSSADSLSAGIYTGAVWFTNLTSGVGQNRTFTLLIGQPDYFTELFDSGANDLDYQTFTFRPDGSTNFYSVCREPATNFPTDPAGGTTVATSDDTSTQVTLSGTNRVALYGRSTNVFFIGSNGYITFGSGDSTYVESFAAHFNRQRITALYDDLYPSAGMITWKQMSNRVAVTFLNVPEFGVADFNSFQIEMFDDGTIRITYLQIDAIDGLAGLSQGLGTPSGFIESDLSSYGPCALPMALSVPGSATEGDGVLAGQGLVELYSIVSTNRRVRLTSSDISEARVPTTVTVFAGQHVATFNVTIIDDSDLDGVQSATFTATFPEYATVTETIQVNDNESAGLNITAPASATEGDAPVSATIVASATPVADITVSLSSSDTTEIQVPPSVLLPAGQTSATFSVSIANDTQIDGDQVAQITAHVPNWTDGFANILVHDNEPTNLVVQLPASAREGNGVLPGAGSVRLSGTLPTNLVVSLLSGDTTELAVPPTSTIPAGQLSATFDLSIVDDPDIDSSQIVTVTANAPGFIAGATNMTITDNESPPEPFNPSPAHLSVDVIQTTDLSWQSGAAPGEVITNDVYFGTNPTPGPGQFIGSTTNSSWALPILAPQTTYYWQIVARKVGITPGPIWRFTTLGVDHFVWNPISSPQFANQPFGATVTAKDAFETTVSNFTGTVALSGIVGGAFTTHFQDDFEDGDFADWTSGSLSATRAVSSNTAAGGIRSFTITGGSSSHYQGIWHSLSNLTPDRIDFHVRKSNTTQAGGYFVVADAPNGSTTTTSNTAVFFYMTSSGLGIYDISIGGQRAVPYVANQWYKITLMFNWPNRRVDFYVDDVLAYTNIPFRGAINSLSILHLYNFDPVQAWWDEIEITEGDPVVTIPITPTNSGNFINGAWTGNITVLQQTSNIVLRADNAGHTGLSGPFAVLVQNDIAVSVEDSPDPVGVGANLTYTVTVTNTGPSAATGVIVTNLLPPSVALLSVNPSQGTYTTVGQTIICNLGTIAGAAQATATIVVAPATAANVTNITMVSRADADGNPPNNIATNTTSVVMPSININNSSVLEGNNGSANLMFTAVLSVDSPQTVLVNYATADGSAQAGSDYAPTNGMLSFPPGQTNQPIFVQIFGDTNAEPNETFSVVLSNPVNATLGTVTGTATIINDDTGPFLDDFEPGIDLPQWSGFGGGVGSTILATNYGGSVSPVNSLWFGDSGTRFATSRAIYTSSGGTIRFFLRFGNGVSPWELADLPGEGVALEYSINNGSSWTIISSYTTSTFYNWTEVAQSIPVGAQSPATQFRWRQLLHSGTGFDHWALDNVAFEPFLSPPSITSQPQNQTVTVGGTATFCVTASGEGPISYFWRRGGVSIVGATQSCYTLTNCQSIDSGSQFSCLVSNASATVLSSNATLTVESPPSISMQPSSQTVAAGSTVNFIVVASGDEPLRYRWRKGASVLPNQTNATLTLANVQTDDAGSYSVLVTNLYGSTTSSNALLSVIPGADLNALLIWDTENAGTLALSNALANDGIAVTLSAADERSYNGSNPSPAGFDAVIHLNGTTYDMDMPASGQITLSNYVAGGGGYIHTEWNSYEYSQGLVVHLRDLILFDYLDYGEGAMNLSAIAEQTGHPVLGNVPSNFTFQAGFSIVQVHAFPTNPVTVLMRQSGTSDAVAVREMGAGRIVGFSHAGNYEDGLFHTLSNTNVQRLYINAVRWAAGSDALRLLFSSPALNGDTLQLLIGTVDGSAIAPDRVDHIQLYGTTNVSLTFNNWTQITNEPVLTNGVLQFNGLSRSNAPAQFFRAVESP